MTHKIESWIVTLLFIETGIISLVLSIMNLVVPINFENIGRIIRYCFYLLVFSFLFVSFLKRTIKNIRARHYKMIFIVLPFVLIIPEICNCFTNSFDSSSIRFLGQFIIFALPYYFIVPIIISEENKVDVQFLKNYKWLGIILLPFYCIYIMRLFGFVDSSTSPTDIGFLNYMDIAYFIIPVFLGSSIDLFLFDNEKTHKYIALLSSVISFICIVFTGTRGAILLGIAFSILLMLYVLIFKEGNRNRVLAFTIIICFLGAILPNIWLPPSARLANSDSKFFYEQTELQNQVPLEKKVQRIVFNYAVESDSSYKESVSVLVDKAQKGELQEELGYNISKETEGYLKNKNESDFYLLSRISLYRLAIREFTNAKIFGNGFYYYINKYETYPHNAILELLCDTGIVGTVLFVIIILGILVGLWKRMKDNRVAAIIIYALPYTISYLVSGSVYLDVLITFYISCGTYILFSNYNSLRK